MIFSKKEFDSSISLAKHKIKDDIKKKFNSLWYKKTKLYICWNFSINWIYSILSNDRNIYYKYQNKKINKSFIKSK